MRVLEERDHAHGLGVASDIGLRLMQLSITVLGHSEHVILLLFGSIDCPGFVRLKLLLCRIYTNVEHCVVCLVEGMNQLHSYETALHIRVDDCLHISAINLSKRNDLVVLSVVLLHKLINELLALHARFLFHREVLVEEHFTHLIFG